MRSTTRLYIEGSHYWWDERLRRWRSVESYDGGITHAEILQIGRFYDDPLPGGLQ